MAQAIRVTVTHTYEYIPDIDEHEYAAQGVYSLQDALELDKRDYKAGKVSLDELCNNLPRETAVWEIVEDST